MTARHWSVPYLGRPWRAGEYECLDLVVEVQRARWGREIELPPYAATYRGREAQVVALGIEYAQPLAAPEEGALALMSPLGARGPGHHLGVATEVEGRWHVLHCARHAATCLHEAELLPVYGWALRGWYRWRAAPGGAGG